MRVSNKYIEVIFNVIFNIISSALLVAVIQLIIFPSISRRTSVDTFGVIAAVYGFKNLAIGVFGNSLNNVRLINTDDDIAKGNFNRLGIIALLLVTLLTLPLYIIYGSNELSVLEIVVLLIATLISSARVYLMVYFRYNLVYFKILMTNLSIAVFMLLGLGLYFIIGVWPIIFLLGELAGLIYIIINTDFLKENISTDSHYSRIGRDYKDLVLSNGIVNGFNYLDRFFIIPILGTASMSIYFSVSVTAKFIGMLTTPFTNVLLSYINRSNPNNSQKNFKKMLVVTLTIILPMYIILNLATPTIIRILYPNFYNASLQYIWIVNLFTTISLATSILNPFLIKFVQLKYQVHIQLLYGIVYFGLALILSNFYGLMGFCYATLLSYSLKLILTIVLGLYKIDRGGIY